MTPSRPQGGEEEQASGPHRWTREAAQEAGRKGAEARKRKALLAAHARAEGEAEGSAQSPDRGAAQDGMAASGVRSSATGDTDQRVLLARVPIPVGDIIRTLSRDAKGGDTAAARELRAWLSQFPPDDSAADASDLAAPQRSRIAALLARLIAEDEEQAANEAIREGTKSGFDALPQSAPKPVGHPRDDGSHRDERGSRDHIAIDDTLAPACPRECTCPPGGPCQINGSHTSDGTGHGSQMTVDDCIEEAENGGS